jgi:formylglycine-generating enzyme required for sulfatase activity
VGQWCEDQFESKGDARVVRGGSFDSSGSGAMLSSSRSPAPPGNRYNSSGFRCVLAPAAAASTPAVAPAQVGNSVPASTPSPTAPALQPSSPSTPAPAATKPPSEIEKWLAQVDAPQEEAFQKQVVKPFETGVADLRARYHTALDARISRASAANQLNEALAWRTEKQAFEKAQNVASDDAGAPAAVKALRVEFRQQFTQLEQERAARARIIHAQYDAILAQNQTVLTQRSRLDDALLLKTQRDEIARAWLGPAPFVTVGADGRSESAKPGTALGATADQPFVNSLGMKFVPVPIIGGPTGGRRVLFSVWDTRVQDYEAFVKETNYDWPKAGFPQGPTHPAVFVSWDDAQLFCKWLTARDHAAGLLPEEWRYRLPSDHEWSCAVGIGAKEDPPALPSDKSGKIDDVFPWGSQWPPPKGAGNYAGEELRPEIAAGRFTTIKEVITGYDDGFAYTSPVGSFPANRFGLFDMGGNVWQWCEDWHDKRQVDHVLRGASWAKYERNRLLSSHRYQYVAGARFNAFGFRCVVGPSAP